MDLHSNDTQFTCYYPPTPGWQKQGFHLCEEKIFELKTFQAKPDWKTAQEESLTAASRILGRKAIDIASVTDTFSDPSNLPNSKWWEASQVWGCLQTIVFNSCWWIYSPLAFPYSFLCLFILLSIHDRYDKDYHNFKFCGKKPQPLSLFPLNLLPESYIDLVVRNSKLFSVSFLFEFFLICFSCSFPLATPFTLLNRHNTD